MATSPQPRVLPLSALLLLLVSAATAAAQIVDESLAVEQGTLVEGCGGFAGGCREYRLRGELELRLDAAAATAVILAEDLEIAEAGAQFERLRLPVHEIFGTVEDSVIRLVSVADAQITFDWTLTRTVGGFLLQGTYDQGCCDLFAFDFRNVSFDERPAAEPSTVLLLSDGRFGVEVRYQNFDGDRGTGRAVEQGSDSGYFWFFSPANTEVVVKLIDACAAYDRFWFFAAGLTNLEVEVTVTDFVSGDERRYQNPMGRTFETILDVDAFPTCG